MSTNQLSSCDIFCTVVDNYGDIGVCWRLARIMQREHAMTVRMWVDDLASFSKLCPEVEPSKLIQQSHGVEIRQWNVLFGNVIPAELVIEAFACELPIRYVQAMADKSPKPVWINLEYMSAEDWVDGCHGLPSPHLKLPLVKYFFFPGFTNKTGGLLLERDLLARRDDFQADHILQEKYWQSLQVPQRQRDELRVSLFSYENPAVQTLLKVWASGPHPVTCLVPEGRVLPQVAEYCGRERLVAGNFVQSGRLRVQVLPFVEQEKYDKLLWACDVNFVRGEDSCVRAQWAGKPFVWQIYPQHDGVHMQKLQALLDLYCRGLDPASTLGLQQLWMVWNSGEEGSETGLEQVWQQMLQNLPVLLQHAQGWAQQLASNNLALNLLDFSRKVGKIAPFEI